MIFKQFYLGCLAQASYLIGDEKTKTAAVVDPRRDVDEYLREARKRGLKIRHVILTHFHADFVSGHLELQKKGAQIYLGARARADYPFVPLKEGDRLEFGDVRLSILETPGHTPEAISVLVYDLGSKTRGPQSVLTGDTLFIGDVGRPDLMASEGMSAQQLAGMLYDSLRKKLMPLPERTLVYPAHGAGSMCGKNISSDTVSTIGAQHRGNYALKPMSKARFISMVTADQPEAPGYFSYDAHCNKSLRPTLDQALKKLKPLSLAAALKAQAQGAQMLDTRDPAEYARSHIKGSVNIGLAGKFATWAGTLLGREKPILILADPGREKESAVRLCRIGLDNIRGYLKGGISALQRAPLRAVSTPRITPEILAGQLASLRPPLVLDVRTQEERDDAQIKGSLHIPLNQLLARARRLPTSRKIVVLCAGGYRSSIAASLLEGRGHRQVSDLIGGMAAWQSSPRPYLKK